MGLINELSNSPPWLRYLVIGLLLGTGGNTVGDVYAKLNPQGYAQTTTNALLDQRLEAASSAIESNAQEHDEFRERLHEIEILIERHRSDSGRHVPNRLRNYGDS